MSTEPDPFCIKQKVLFFPCNIFVPDKLNGKTKCWIQTWHVLLNLLSNSATLRSKIQDVIGSKQPMTTLHLHRGYKGNKGHTDKRHRDQGHLSSLFENDTLKSSAKLFLLRESMDSNHDKGKLTNVKYLTLKVRCTLLVSVLMWLPFVLFLEVNMFGSWSVLRSDTVWPWLWYNLSPDQVGGKMALCLHQAPCFSGIEFFY